MELTQIYTPKRTDSLVGVEVAAKYKNPLIRWRRRAEEASAPPNSAVIIEVGAPDCDPSESTVTPEMPDGDMWNNITLYIKFFNPRVRITGDHGGAGENICTWVAKGLWISLSIVSLLNPILFLLNIKRAYQSTEIHQSKFIETGYIITDLMANLLCLHLLSSFSTTRDFQTLLKTVRQWPTDDRKMPSLFSKFKNCGLALCLIASSVLVACGGAVLGAGLITIDSTWTFADVLETHFLEICNAFVHVGEQKHVNVTANLTSPSSCDTSGMPASVVAIGILGCLADFGAFLLESCILDLFIVMTFAILQKTKAIVKYTEIQRCSNQSSFGEHGNMDADPGRILAMQRVLFDMSHAVEKALGTMFRAMQLRNLLLTVYFIHELLLGPKNGLFFLVSHRVVKMILGYYCCVSITNKVGEIRNWLRSYYSQQSQKQQNDPCTNTSIIVACVTALDEMTHTPIGIGRNGFYVDEQLIGTSVGIVLAYFFILAGSS